MKRIFIVLIFLLYGCSSSDDVAELNSSVSTNDLSQNQSNNVVDSSNTTNEQSNNDSSSFDRSQMLNFIVGDIIIPSFENLTSDLNDLKTSFEIFKSSTNQTNLDDLRSKWLKSYKSCNMSKCIT